MTSISEGGAPSNLTPTQKDVGGTQEGGGVALDDDPNPS